MACSVANLERAAALQVSHLAKAIEYRRVLRA
jgi:predicted ATPase with chaperone activity